MCSSIEHRIALCIDAGSRCFARWSMGEREKTNKIWKWNGGGGGGCLRRRHRGDGNGDGCDVPLNSTYFCCFSNCFRHLFSLSFSRSLSYTFFVTLCLKFTIFNQIFKLFASQWTPKFVEKHGMDCVRVRKFAKRMARLGGDVVMHGTPFVVDLKFIIQLCRLFNRLPSDIH